MTARALSSPRRFCGDLQRWLLLVLAISAPWVGAREAEPDSRSVLPPTAVDTHAHIFERDAGPLAGRRYVPDYAATAADLLQRLDAHQISHGVLVQPSFLRTDNSLLLAALREHPGRLRGIVVVEPGIAPAELARMDGEGVVGIRLNLMGLPLPALESAPWAAFLCELKRLNWLVEIHCEARDLPPVVGPLLAAGLNVVVDHFGRPDPALGVQDPGFRYLLTQAHTRQLWVKLSGAYRNGPEGIGDAVADVAAPLLLGAFGAEHLLWGSDWPHTQFEQAEEYSEARAQLDRWVPNPAERATILRTTPGRLFRFQPASNAPRD